MSLFLSLSSLSICFFLSIIPSLIPLSLLPIPYMFSSLPLCAPEQPGVMVAEEVTLCFLSSFYLCLLRLSCLCTRVLWLDDVLLIPALPWIIVYNIVSTCNHVCGKET